MGMGTSAGGKNKTEGERRVSHIEAAPPWGDGLRLSVKEWELEGTG